MSWSSASHPVVDTYYTVQGQFELCERALILTFMCALALLSRPRVVWRLQSGPSGMRAFNRSRHSRRWARLQERQDQTNGRIRYVQEQERTEACIVSSVWEVTRSGRCAGVGGCLACLVISTSTVGSQTSLSHLRCVAPRLRYPLVFPMFPCTSNRLFQALYITSLPSNSNNVQVFLVGLKYF